MKKSLILLALLPFHGSASAQSGSIGDTNASVLCSTQLSNDSSTKCANTSFVGLLNAAKISTIKIQSFCPSGCSTIVAEGGNGTYTKSPGMLYAVVEIIGAGGGGGSAVGAGGNFVGGAGGGGGGYLKMLFTAADLSASTSLTIGNGGAGGSATSGGTSGTGGGTTSFNSVHSAAGGDLGFFTSMTQRIGTPGVGGVPTTTMPAKVMAKNTGSPGMGGHGGSQWGISGAGGAAGNGSGGGVGTGTITGGTALTGLSATGAGGGGSGGFVANSGSQNAAGGNGAPGAVYITEYCSQ